MQSEILNLSMLRRETRSGDDGDGGGDDLIRCSYVESFVMTCSYRERRMKTTMKRKTFGMSSRRAFRFALGNVVVRCSDVDVAVKRQDESVAAMLRLQSALRESSASNLIGFVACLERGQASACPAMSAPRCTPNH